MCILLCYSYYFITLLILVPCSSFCWIRPPILLSCVHTHFETSRATYERKHVLSCLSYALLTISCLLFPLSLYLLLPKHKPESIFMLQLNRPQPWSEYAILIFLNISYFIWHVYLQWHRISCRWHDFLLPMVSRPPFYIYNTFPSPVYHLCWF